MTISSYVYSVNIVAESSSSTNRYHHGDLRAALVAAGRKLLEQEGPEALSFRAIARMTGVSQTAPYNHFRNKVDLLATIAEQGFRGLAASQVTAMESAPPDEQCIALGLDYMRFALAHPQLYRLMFGVGVSDWCAHPVVLEAKKASFGPVQAALAQYLGKGADVETAAVAIWALVHGLSMLLLDGSLGPAKGSATRDEQIDRVIRWFAAGLALQRAGGQKSAVRRKR